jgi:UDP-glucose 4-epimerase
MTALAGADAVIHLAGRAHVMHETAADPLAEFRSVNVAGTEQVCACAANAGVRRFIYLSSIKVNGEETAGSPFQADDQPHFSDFYGQSKWEAEQRLRAIAEEAGMEWVCVRPPLVYGPGVRGNFLSLMKILSRGVPLPLRGIHNKRSLVSVYNLCDFLERVMVHPGAANQRFLVKDQEDISTVELIRYLAAVLGKEPRLLWVPAGALTLVGKLLHREDAIHRLCSSLLVSTDKAKERLGWRAPMPVMAGLKATGTWFSATGGNGVIEYAA